MNGGLMKKEISRKHLTAKQQAEINTLAKMSDQEIDISDAPEVRSWKGAQRGLFYKPVKHQLTLRLDADVVAWFKSKVREGKGYQTRINSALREYIEEHAG
jgi:uncharacterized protein (DUF4415 family)